MYNAHRSENMKTGLIHNIEINIGYLFGSYFDHMSMPEL